MKDQTLERDQFIAAPIEQVFERYADAENLDDITPPWFRFEVLSLTPIAMQQGTLIEHRLWLHRIPLRWQTEIERWNPPHGFTDVQVRGPYSLWSHTHIFEAVDGGTMARDRVRYRVGFGPLGMLAFHLLVRRDVERIFDYRRDAILRLLAGGVDSVPANHGSEVAANPAAIDHRR